MPARVAQCVCAAVGTRRDMRAALTAFLWASGKETEAESEWSALCVSGRGFGAAQSANAAGEVYSPAYDAELLRQQVRDRGIAMWDRSMGPTRGTAPWIDRVGPSMRDTACGIA